ncbi:MAG: ANTAR domain-containing protein [Candidatus Thiodiazotropha sp. (ex. Lucinisca nassula)]|uniref:ANTAR domain-containing response regulator n=1 Tax=Candidatus Thiodiazotropha sp. LNASS1 TaxID=3096260 RepID=UPI0028141709|nr:ANTAR domain-containing protein [Candidatus Thiodiazotropha sp. (ex. Lucinisca nassula)]
MSETENLKILLVDENRGRSAILERALVDNGQQVIAILDSGENLSAQVAALQPDVIIIDLESPDRDILEQMHTISRDNPRPVVMFSDDNDNNSITQAIVAGVSAYVVDGLNDKRIKPLMDVAIARFREYQALKDELTLVKNTLEERKIIERAKGIIMKRKDCDEESAYQLLRKTAMGSNQRVVDVARNLISSLELLG